MIRIKNKIFRGAVALSAVVGASLVAVACGSSDNGLKIGYLADYSGNLAHFGTAIERGVELAVEQINEAGGVNGEDVSYVTADTGLDNTMAISEARRLITVDGVHAIVGPIASGVTLAVAENVTVEAGIPTVAPAATSPSITEVEDNGFLFRTALSDVAQGAVLADDLVEPAGQTNVGVLYVNNAYGQGLAEAFEANFDGEAELLSYEEDAAVFNAELQQISERDALVVIGYDESGIAVRAALQDDLFDTIFFVDGNNSPDVVETVGATALEGQRGTTQGSGITDASRAFDEAHMELFPGEEVFQFTREAYDAVIAIALAAEAANSFDGAAIRDELTDVATRGGQLVIPTVASIRAGLEAANAGRDVNYDGAASTVEWDENGDITSGFIEIWEFKDGTPTEVEVVPFSLND